MPEHRPPVRGRCWVRGGEDSANRELVLRVLPAALMNYGGHMQSIATGADGFEKTGSKVVRSRRANASAGWSCNRSRHPARAPVVAATPTPNAVPAPTHIVGQPIDPAAAAESHCRTGEQPAFHFRFAALNDDLGTSI